MLYNRNHCLIRTARRRIIGIGLTSFRFEIYRRMTTVILMQRASTSIIVVVVAGIRIAPHYFLRWMIFVRMITIVSIQIIPHFISSSTMIVSILRRKGINPHHHHRSYCCHNHCCRSGTNDALISCKVEFDYPIVLARPAYWFDPRR